MESLLLALRLLVGGVFATAGAAKLADREGSRGALEDFGAPHRLARPGAVLLPLAELAIAIGLVFPPTARPAALMAIILLGTFVVVIANAIAHGRAPDCHCFGQIHSEPAGWSTLARNGVLAALAATVLAFGPGPSLTGWVAERSAAELTAVAAGLVAAALVWRWLRAWVRRRERRRFAFSALERIESQSRPAGLPVGTGAPQFELREVHGQKLTLEALRGRGAPVVLMFVHPFCGPCRELIPEIDGWQGALAERLTIVVVSQGAAAHSRRLQEKHGIADFMLQKRNEVYDAYEVRGTPSAVVVGRDGAIQSATVTGRLPIEELIRLTLHQDGSWSEDRLVA